MQPCPVFFGFADFIRTPGNTGREDCLTNQPLYARCVLTGTDKLKIVK